MPRSGVASPVCSDDAPRQADLLARSITSDEINPESDLLEEEEDDAHRIKIYAEFLKLHQGTAGVSWREFWLVMEFAELCQRTSQSHDKAQQVEAKDQLVRSAHGGDHVDVFRKQVGDVVEVTQQLVNVTENQHQRLAAAGGRRTLGDAKPSVRRNRAFSQTDGASVRKSGTEGQSKTRFSGDRRNGSASKGVIRSEVDAAKCCQEREEQHPEIEALADRSGWP
jgi:hypothetical protein